MFYEEFSTDIVEDMIDSCARQMVDDYDDDVDVDERLFEVVENAVMYNCDALAIIAYYGVFDALKGCDYEDSPLNQFCNDVYDAYYQLTETEEGRE